MALSPALPGPAFATRRLVTATVLAGSTWRRMYETRFSNPLGYGPGLSRFSDPTGKAFGLLYLASSAKVAFVETILRDRADGRSGDCIIAESEIRKRSMATISPIAPLTLVDLTGDGPIKMGVRSDVVGARNQTTARYWSVAFHNHATLLCGVLHHPRHTGPTPGVMDNLHRFVPPWSVEEGNDQCFRVYDATGFFICSVKHQEDLHARAF
jgi:hypothetical protein